MTSNGKPQLVRDIFTLQSNGAAAEAVNASVGQDKVRASPVRIGTNQPVPLTKITRTQKVARKKPRSQNRPTPKRQRVLIGVWVQPIVKEELQRIAKREGVSVSKTSAAFLEQALQQNIDLKYSALLTPIIEAAIDKRMRSRDSRLAWLLVRVAFDTGQTRAIVANILGRQQNMTEEKVKNILAMSQRTAKGNITRRTPQIAELMEAVEQWLAPDNGNREGNLH
jgi:hypothetical protein